MQHLIFLCPKRFLKKYKDAHNIYIVRHAVVFVTHSILPLRNNNNKRSQSEKFKSSRYVATWEKRKAMCSLLASCI